MPKANRSPLRLAAPDARERHATSTLRFYEDEFVFDTVSGLFYRMNPAACFILRALDSGVDAPALAGLLQAHYGLDRASAARDVELFLNDLSAIEPLNRLHPRKRAAG